MTTTRSKTRRPRTSADPVAAYAQAVVRGKAAAGPHVRAACARHLRDLKGGAARGLKWDRAAATRAIGYFRDVLRLAGGEHEGKPFILEPWQAFIVGSLFGWKGPDGYRRFRVAYVEAGKGAGKSPLAAGIGLYGMTADGEPRAEVYTAATKKDQAMILFRDAVAMVDQSPALASRLVKSGSNPTWNLADLRTASFFRPVASDDAQSGPRPHIALLDEIHEHRTGNVVEMMRAGTKGRRQALVFMITNSGHDRASVCYDYHEYGAKVSAGEVEDDSFFAYICGLDSGGTETYDVDVSVERMISACNCSARTTLKDLQNPEGFARAVTSAFGSSGTSKQARSALSTLIEQSFLAAFATTATRSGSRPSTRSTGSPASNTESSGRLETAIRATLQTLGIGSAPRRKIRSGKLSADADGSTGWRPPKSQRSSDTRADNAESAEAIFPIHDLTTAIAQELSEDSSAISAMRESGCSEITSRLFNEHSPTCRIRQQYRLSAGKLVADLPVDDPFRDRKCWAKANPSLGVTIPEKYLEEQVTQAKGMPAKESIVRRLNFCQWVDAANPWIDGDLWRSCERPPDGFPSDEELAARPCFLGLDLSGKRDLTAMAAVWPDGEGWAARTWFWTPADTLIERERTDRVPYAAWARAEHLTAVPGRSIAYEYVARFLAELDTRFALSALAFDPYRIEDFERELDGVGLDAYVWEGPEQKPAPGLRLVRHGQGYTGGASASSLWMPRSVTTLEEAVLSGSLQIRKSPVLTWCSASAVLVEDPAGNKKWDKRKSTGRIDGIVALSMALGLAASAPVVGPKPSVYESRGVRTFG